MDDKPFTPISGAKAQETAEPIGTTGPASGQTTPSTSKPARDTSTSSIPTTKKLLSKRNPSSTNSPIPSRESSPNRPALKNVTSARSTTGPGRSRKNSSQETSPSRSASTSTNPPSAAAQQRALSAAPIPTLHPASSDTTVKAPVPQKAPVTSEIRETPRWPVSPRLRSPPPVNRPSVISPRKTDQDLQGINVYRSQATEQQEGRATTDSETEDLLSIPGMRTPARGVSGANSTLATVQEISQPNTPGITLDGALEKATNGTSRTTGGEENPMEHVGTSLKSKPSLNESGSESGGKGEIKMRTTSVAPPPAVVRPSGPSKAFTTGGAGRGKASGEGSTKNMTVETETVSSIPQVAVGGPAGGNNGSIRAKPSSETIRPKKEKKKTTRKPPSVTSGTGELPNSSKRRQHHHHHSVRADIAGLYAAWPASGNDQGSFSPPQGTFRSIATSPERLATLGSRRPSYSVFGASYLLTGGSVASTKADIFEAKVASAVDEANSSDSEETFVYESNPPDVNDRPRRFHSRTPSATSMASQVDQRNGVRALMDGQQSVAMKKSMKFANSYSNSTGPDSTTGDDDGKGTARSSMGTARGTTHHHHIGGRWGRNGGNGHPSLFDNESPFPNAAKTKVAGNAARYPSRPESPRVLNARMAGNGKKSQSSGYDLDDGADDERTPLISTIRSSRSVRNRRPPGSLRQLEHQASRHDRSFLSRFAGCLVLSTMISFVVAGVFLFAWATTQSLEKVEVLALKNVLASEQDVILDMKVQARNPNLIAVSIDSTDLVIVAKSKYAGTDSEWWRHPPDRDLKWGMRKGDDDPENLPTVEDPNTNPNLEIGHIYEFDSPLTFEGSPFNHEPSFSLGQLRINHPGNKTTPAGSERWGRVLAHEFELIVRGTLQYTLPLSQQLRKINVNSHVTVKPNAADQDPDTVHII